MVESVNILNKLFLALQNVRFYPPAHSMVQESIAAVFSLLQEELASGRDFAFGFIEGKLIVNGQPVEADASQTRDLARYFEVLHIDSITINPGIAQAELRAFLECLSVKPERLIESGGMKKAIADKGLRHVQANDVAYGRISNEKEKEKEKEIPAAPVRRREPPSRSQQKNTFEGEDFIKALRTADKFKSSGTPPARAPGPESAAADLPMPSADELRELYALRDQFKSEVDRKVKAAVEHYEKENKRLANEKNNMDSIMRNVGDGVVVVGNDGNILMANPAARKLLGDRQGQAVVGQALKETLKDEHSLVLTKGSPESVTEIEVAGKNSETRRVLRTSNAVIEDADGKTIGMVSVLSDITRMKEVEQMKSDFVANVSHELRSPLAAIQKNLLVILDQTAGAINENQKEFLSLARDNVERLTRLVNDILDISKIEAGKMELRKTRLDLADLVRKSTASFSGWFNEKGIRPVFEIPDRPVEAEVDGDKITQVMNNLLSNALKFTPARGEIKVTLRSAGAAAEVSVSDTGAGIEQKDIHRIFNKFEQVSSSHPNGHNGTGLGLPIAKEIIEKHGGKIQVCSAPGSGSTFTFTLPL